MSAENEIIKEIDISSLSDAEFLAFLYSERDRENSLSQYQGWNNWALFGALVTVACASYSILRSSLEEMCFQVILCYTSGFLALVMSLRAFVGLIEHPRGVDYSKIRTLNEVAPVWYILCVLISSAFFALVMAVEDMWGVVAWMWSVVFVAYLVVGIYVWINKKQIVPSYYHSVVFPNRKLQLVFDLIVAALQSEISVKSFMLTQGIQIGPNFEFSVCVSAFLLLVYYLVKINRSNKPVKEFDMIIDDYLYKRETKERTYNKILINRMGYAVLEANKKEIENIKEDVNSYVPRVELLERYKKELDAEIVSLDRLIVVTDNSKEVLGYISNTLDHIEMLRKKMEQMLIMVPTADNIPSFREMFSQIDDVLDKLVNLHDIATEVVEKSLAHLQGYYCKKLGRYCIRLGCDHRNDPRSYKYTLIMWMRKCFCSTNSIKTNDK